MHCGIHIILQISACGLLLPVCGSGPQLCQQRERAQYRARIDSEGNSYSFGKQQECGEVLPAPGRDGEVQAVRCLLMESFCSADDEQGVWRDRAQEEREGGRSVQHHPGQHLLTLQVHTHFQLSKHWQSGKGWLDERKVIFKKKKVKLADNF